MKTPKGILAIAVALLAMATPALAHDLRSRSDDATPCATSASDGERSDRPSGEAAARTLPAEVLSIDEDRGRVVLSTELGTVTVPATPAIIAQLSVGDLVMLRVIPDGDDAPSASPPTEDDASPTPGRRL